MKWQRTRFALLATALALGAAQAGATIMLQMDLGELVTRSDKIFRGTVIEIEQTSIAAGGAELPAVRYTLQVNEMLKGVPSRTENNVSIVEIQMVGKSVHDKPNADGLLKMSMFRDVPKLNKGSDYLLFTTPESAIGLTVTVGLGQGAFRVQPVDGSDTDFTAVNEFNNAGLGLSASGPLSYAVLSDEVRSRLTQ